VKLIITVDTEGDNQWEARLPRSTENIRFIPRFQELCQRYAFSPTYLCTYEATASAAFDDVLLPVHRSGRGEIGAHLHPWTTPPLSPWDRSEVAPAYPSELPAGVFAAKLACLTRLLADKLGSPPRSYRAGRWGLSAAHIPFLLELGYIVDCSVTPLVSWTDRGARERGQDFTDAPVMPYFMAWGDPGRPGRSGLLEVPVTILCTNALMRDSSLLRAVYRRYRKTPPARAMNWLFAIAPRWFRPFSDMSVARLKSVYASARALGLPTIEMMIHSSELMPSGSPHNPTVAAVDDLYARLDAIFGYLAAEGVIGSTLTEFAQAFRGEARASSNPPSFEFAPAELTWAPGREAKARDG
jgi:hypothetical protein